MGKAQQFTNIQGLRAIAALMVVCDHIFGLPIFQTHSLAPYARAIGPAGVDIFFVISGFVVYLSADRLGREKQFKGRIPLLWDLAVKRCFRIYPVYWVAFLLATILLPLAKGINFGTDDQSTLRLLLLMEYPNSRVPAAWTLVYEMYFYAVCAVALFVFPRRILWVLSGWLGAIFVVWLVSWVPGWDYSWYRTLTPFVLEFAFGILIAELVKRDIYGYAASTLAIGVGGLVFGAIVFGLHGNWFNQTAMWRVMCIGFPSAFIVYSLVAIERRSGWVFTGPWNALGDASYSLYLWHQLVFTVSVFAFLPAFQRTGLPMSLFGITLVTIAVFIGFLSYHLIEKPIHRGEFVKRLAEGRPYRYRATIPAE
ncbi:acyltransferase [Brucella anthropi]|uniref:acyltransferase family protein n=1 Tax=Brucella anthropi TaxID=529 RepID=UPI003208F5D1